MLFEIFTKTSDSRRRKIINFTSGNMDFILPHFHNVTLQVSQDDQKRRLLLGKSFLWEPDLVDFLVFKIMIFQRSIIL